MNLLTLKLKLGRLFKNRFFLILLFIMVSTPILLGIGSLFDTGIEIYSLQLFSDEDFSLGTNQFSKVSYQFKPKSVNFYATSSDYRIYVLKKYFERYNSPLVTFASDFVAACDKYKAPDDCTTIPAIAFVETKLCTAGLSAEQKNCWGFGGSGKNRIYFNTYNQAIDFVTKTLVKGYGNYSLENPIRMQYVYCGAHCHNWGVGVQSSRKEISKLSEQLGYPKLLP